MPVPRKPRRACAICGTPVRRPTNIYCSRDCRDIALSLSPNAGTFKKGRPVHNHLPLGSVTVRTRVTKPDGPRAYVKVAEPNIWRLRAVLVWEEENGPVPAGHIVHHHDRDTLNDDLSNLRLETRGEHLKEHRPEFESYRAERASAARWGKR